MIEARHERKGAGARQPAVGRLEAEQAAERGRHADRAVGVGAERDRHQPAGHRAARAARRAARHAVRVVRIARGAVVHVLAGEVVGVLAHVERADQHRAGRLEPRDQRGVGRGGRVLAVDLGAGQRRQAGHVEQVLDRERHAGERPERLAARPGGIDRPRLGQRALARHRRERVEHAVALGDARQRRLGDGDARWSCRCARPRRSRTLSPRRRIALRPRTRAPAPPRPAARSSATSLPSRSVTCEVGLDGRLPRRLDRQLERLGRRLDELVEVLVLLRPSHFSCSQLVGWVSATARDPTPLALAIVGLRASRANPTYPAPHTGGCGMAASSSRVYSASGANSTRSVGPSSTMRPACITITRSHSRRTTLRSCETNR